MTTNQKQLKAQDVSQKKAMKIAIGVLIALLIAIVLYCIKLNFDIKVLKQVCADNEQTYKALYEEYIKVHGEKTYYEKAYDELSEYIYSED